MSSSTADGRGAVPLASPSSHADGRGVPCAYVILAHHKPEQVLRLIDRLAPAPVFLHVDAGAAPGVNERLVAGAAQRPAITLLPRRRSGWASWGQVEPALDGFRAAHERGAAHTVLMTGQDYPLVAAAEIEAFLGQHVDHSFLAYWELPSELWGGGLDRLRYWSRPVRRRRLRVPIPRRLPDGLTFYGGSAYMVLAAPAVAELLAFVETRPDVIRFYRHAWTPDEMFIQTAVLNSPAAANVINENLWYMDWVPGSKHPKVFRRRDADELLAAGGRPGTAGGASRAKLFARKLDAQADPLILDRLDERVLATPVAA